MKQAGMYLMALTTAVGMCSALLLAQAPAAPAQGGRAGGAPPQQPMTFFITSTSKGDGANYGGLAGADAHCQQLAAAVGRGAATWRAYLSTQGPGAVNARDRIGTGPWYNAQGRQVASNLDELHGDTLERARLGNRLNKNTSLTEKGTMVNGVGDMPNQHDILTGTQPDGRAYSDGLDHTCSNYTSNMHVEPLARGGAPPATPPPPAPGVQLGHHDRIGNNTGSWNSAHGTRGCSQMNVMAGGGNGYLYCFAVN
jgi:hypothetical protein